jgi:hypothetical protein
MELPYYYPSHNDADVCIKIRHSQQGGGVLTVHRIAEEMNEDRYQAKVGLQGVGGRRQRVVVPRVHLDMGVGYLIEHKGLGGRSRWRVGSAVAMTMAVTMAMAAVVVNHQNTYYVQTEPDTSYYHHLFWIFDGCNVHKPFNRLKEDGKRERQKENAVEEGA